MSLLRLVPLLALAACGFALGASWTRSDVASFEPRGFVATHSVEVAVPRTEAWSAFTGDILPWWDHTFSDSPTRLVMEARPGGAFFEEFDASGDGAVHARVTFVKTGHELQFVGRLGFAGANANLMMTHRVRFEDAGEGRTRVAVDVHGVGEAGEQDGEVVQRVWTHFLSSRFKPYVEGTLEAR